MITRFANLASRLAAMLTVLFTFTACGGGGGGGFVPDNAAEDRYFISMVLLDLLGEQTNTVTATKPARLEVTVTKKNKGGAPVPDVVVEASSEIVTVSPDTGTGLTNEDGVATFKVEAAGKIGAGSIVASVQAAPTGTETATINVQVIKADLRLGYFDGANFVDGLIDVQPEDTLSPGGTATLTFSAVDEFDNLATTQENVLLASECIAKGLATLPGNPVAFTGTATVSYTAAGCEGDDMITGTLIDTPSQATGTVSVAPLSSIAGKLIYVDADPAVIVVKGTGNGGSRKETTTVRFKVTDVDDNPLRGVDVSFDLSTTLGGLSLGEVSDTSDAAGNVQTTVTSGTTPTTFFVFATIDAKGISTTSGLLAVSTGVVDQRGISLSVSGGGHVIENGFNTDGVERIITVHMQDRFGSPGLDGTLALFETEYGDIDPSCSLGISNGPGVAGTPLTGECSVLWASGDPRLPSDVSLLKRIDDDGFSCDSYSGKGPCPDDLGAARGGRSTVSVSTDGEEWFDDANNNNRYDQGEDFENLPEAFTDNNEDDVYTPVVGPECDNPPTTQNDCAGAGADETYVDRNNDGMYNTNDDPARYNGILCPPEGEGVYCSSELVSVNADVVLILSDASSWDSALVNPGLKTKVTSTSWNDDFAVYISDQYNNPPPAGSTVSFEVLGDCDLDSAANLNVPDMTEPGAFAAELRTDGEGSDGNVRVTLAATDGSSYEMTYGCIVREPPDPNDRIP